MRGGVESSVISGGVESSVSGGVESSVSGGVESVGPANVGREPVMREFVCSKVVPTL